MDNYYKELGLNLRRLRRLRDITQQELAEGIGKSHSAISKYEQANVKPEADVLQEIAEFYGVSLSSFMPSAKKQHKK